MSETVAPVHPPGCEIIAPAVFGLIRVALGGAAFAPARRLSVPPTSLIGADDAVMIGIEKRESRIGLINHLRKGDLAVAVGVEIAKAGNFKQSVLAGQNCKFFTRQDPIVVDVRGTEEVGCILLPFIAGYISVPIEIPCHRRGGELTINSRSCRERGFVRRASLHRA